MTAKNSFKILKGLSHEQWKICSTIALSWFKFSVWEGENITKEMTYDVDNRLDTYTQTEGTKVTTQSNLYNGDGQRIQKQEGITL